MAFLQPSPGRAVRGKARSLARPCSAGGRRGDQIALPANTKVPRFLAASSSHQSSPLEGVWADGAVQPPLGAGRGGAVIRAGAAPGVVPATLHQTLLSGAPRLQGTGGAHRSPAPLPGTSQEYSPAPWAGWYRRSLLQIRLTQAAAEQGRQQEPRTQTPSLQNWGACQQHSSPCHMRGQAAHQLPNPAAPPHTIRGGRGP